MQRELPPNLADADCSKLFPPEDAREETVRDLYDSRDAWRRAARICHANEQALQEWAEVGDLIRAQE